MCVCVYVWLTLIVFGNIQCKWEVEDSASGISVPSGPNSQNGSASVNDDGGGGVGGEPVKVCYLTEQTSHHPPVSAFYIECPDRGVSARGYDQISAKFTGTSVRVVPGEYNRGIFVNIEKRDNEEYQMSHPAAHLGGILRGALSITVSDTCYITCPRTRIKTILQYQEDSWIGRAQYKVEGLVFRYNPEDDTATKIKDVAEGDILARISGSWHGQIHYTLAKTTDSQLLIDIAPLFPAAKTVPPEETQLSNESRKFWSGVTEAILDKRYSQATKLKQDIEERQRQKAAERQKNNETWQPRFFTSATTASGKPELTEEGRQTLMGVRNGEYKLEESEKLGA